MIEVNGKKYEIFWGLVPIYQIRVGKKRIVEIRVGKELISKF